MIFNLQSLLLRGQGCATEVPAGHYAAPSTLAARHLNPVFRQLRGQGCAAEVRAGHAAAPSTLAAQHLNPVFRQLRGQGCAAEPTASHFLAPSTGESIEFFCDCFIYAKNTTHLRSIDEELLPQNSC